MVTSAALVVGWGSVSELPKGHHLSGKLSDRRLTITGSDVEEGVDAAAGRSDQSGVLIGGARHDQFGRGAEPEEPIELPLTAHGLRDHRPEQFIEGGTSGFELFSIAAADWSD
jgi:hypothetical protein